MTGSLAVEQQAHTVATAAAPSPATPKKEVNSIRFNQDGSSLVVASQEGFRVFDLSSTGGLVITFDFSTIPQVIHIQRLYSTNLTAFVTAIEPETLKIFNLRRNEVICEHRYAKPINWLAVNRLRVLVAAEEKVV
ncbi:hypothetical protein RvY_17580 [Ramazzottius varieornatus]|uniref:Anaphase-promoting complex subunit 4 WD40 domain-containing protein n=1 Tax=Ramazzottius varieornatus TaxID=947166 RepID=A0A1D1W6F3_RAMVA|nr:hypothetical protein RvY_17580 [Ramazzottius varieornatus]